MISIDREMLWQWDRGQRVQLHDVPVGTAVHFSNAAIKPNALVKEAYEDGEGVYANIPNILLQTAGTLTAYIYLEDGDEGHTEYRKMFIVRDREKPDDYVYTEDEVKTWEVLEERIKALEENGGGGAAADGLIRPLSTIGEIDGVTVKHVPDKDRVELTVEMTADSMNSVFGGNAVYKNDFLNARQLQLMFRIPGAGRLFLWELFEDDLITVTNYPNKKLIMVSTNRMIVSLTYDENGQFVSETKTYQANVQKVEEMIAEAVAGLPQSDWNQSDETAPDYIKNRTHYEYTERNEVLAISVTGSPFLDTGKYVYDFRDGELNHYSGKRGDTVLVVFDGVEYYCTQVGDFNDSGTNYGYVIGNTSIVDDGGMGDGIGQMPEIDTGEPFAIWNQNYYTPNSGIVLRDGNNHTIEVYAFEKKAKPIDDKFLPEDLAKKTPVFASYWSNVDTGEHKIGEIDPNTPSVVIPMTMQRFYELTRGHEEFIVRHDRKTIRFGAHLSSVSIGNSAELKNDGNVQLTTYYISHSNLILEQKSVTVVDMDELPESLPNPHPLIFTGAVEATYDGSTPVEVEIPMGGGGSENLKLRLVCDIVVDPNEAPDKITIDRDIDGNPFELKKVLIYSDLKSNVSYTSYAINGKSWVYRVCMAHGTGYTFGTFGENFTCSVAYHDGKYARTELIYEGQKLANGAIAAEKDFGAAKSFEFFSGQEYGSGTFIKIFEVLE